ncbi:HAD hydrolase-like protein [Pelagibius litoralis]|uniref:phosphoglycolate phosphatase n=1 Tax=Pelagibius litoralis TaxID=374515 RepID=A0A967C2U6_9PROT|nr:HAD hydrolase-like protein [Pelagibius litoralis]NIA67359.1 HAD hydrolase-like protein [Pelagibius litoralis]
MKLARPRAVIFDWDNTLVDSWAVIHHALSTTFEALGEEPWTLAETRQRVRKSARDSFPELFGPRAGEATEVFYRTYEADHLAQLNPLPGAEAMLQGLAELPDLKLAVVSNKKGTLLRKEALHLGWERHFVSLVGANDAEQDKPAPEVVDFALAGSGIAAGPGVWFVGDTDIDLVCAENSGCTAILLRPDAPAAMEFDGTALDFHVPDCAGFSELVIQSLK